MSFSTVYCPDLKKSPNGGTGKDIHAELQPFFPSKAKSSASPMAQLSSVASLDTAKASGSSGLSAQQLSEHQSKSFPLPQGSPGGGKGLGLSAGHLPLSQYSSVDATLSPALFLKTHLEAPGSSEPSAGLLLLSQPQQLSGLHQGRIR